MKLVKIARCPYCNKLLFKYDYYSDLDISIECPSCKRELFIKTKGGVWNE